MVLCVSIPASELEMNPSDQHDHESFKKLLDRLGKAIMMSADTEIAEIIRRRLFEWGGMPDEGRRTAAAYAEWAVEHAAELSGIDRDTALEAFQACYPFHPLGAVGLRAEMGRASPFPADARRFAAVGAVGGPRLPRGTQPGAAGTTDHVRLGTV